MMTIHESIIYGLVFRIIATIFLLKYVKNVVSIQHWYIVIPIMLTVLDWTDNIFIKILYQNNSLDLNNDYQIKDKIVDLLSYYFTWYLFGMDNIYLYLTIYRTIGVFLYMKYKNGKIFVAFPDLFKELMVYQHFFKGDNKYLPALIGGKMLFEYFMHRNKK